MKLLKSLFSTTNIIVGGVIALVGTIILLLLGWKPTAVEIDAGPISVEFAPNKPTETNIVIVTLALENASATSTQAAIIEKAIDLTPTAKIIVITATPNISASEVQQEDLSQHQPISPDLFIQNYYDAINQRKYELAFSWLSANFKDKYHCCQSDGSYDYGAYVDWWNTVKQVQVRVVEIRELGVNTSTVYAMLNFLYKDGRSVDDQHIFYLISDGSNWFINEQGG